MRRLTRKQRRAHFESVQGVGAYARRLGELRLWRDLGWLSALVPEVVGGCHALYPFWFTVYHGSIPLKDRERVFVEMGRMFSKRSNKRARELSRRRHARALQTPKQDTFCNWSSE